MSYIQKETDDHLPTLAQASMIFVPVGTLPVNDILAMSGWWHRSWPVSASPWKHPPEVSTRTHHYRWPGSYPPNPESIHLNWTQRPLITTELAHLLSPWECSNWTLTPCQQHKITWGWTNTVVSQPTPLTFLSNPKIYQSDLQTLSKHK